MRHTLAISTALALSLAVGVTSQVRHGPAGSAGGPRQGAGAQPQAGRRHTVLVVAPHPDDEVITASGVLYDAVRAGDAASVVVLTNGDYTCRRDGWLRQSESVRALQLLGLVESQVIFLGYPDGHLPELGQQPLPPVERRTRDGLCTMGNTTYGDRGRGLADHHTFKNGQPASYTAEALEADLADVLDEVRPDDVYVTHGLDAHPDHAATYAYLRRALERSRHKPSGQIHRAIVHAGPCWPNGRNATGECGPVEIAPTTDLPALPDPFSGYRPRERRLRASPFLDPDPTRNLEVAVLGAHVSQVIPEFLDNWLMSFVRREETFYPEVLAPTSAQPPHMERVAVKANAPTNSPACSDYLVVRFREGASSKLELRALLPPSQKEPSPGDEPGYRRLRSWTLPHDTRSEDAIAVDLTSDPRPDDGDVVELTLRVGGRVLGSSIDPTPTADCTRYRQHTRLVLRENR